MKAAREVGAGQLLDERLVIAQMPGSVALPEVRVEIHGPMLPRFVRHGRILSRTCHPTSLKRHRASSARSKA